ncbi:DUF6531 domain-containing protein [Stenotrophomonas indicatrix]|uniref:DUF6531 domain-containing protein n=1 Tax=Stenotrophomonas indicatrix TaxID=2045451 RepID=UPI00249A05FC|nr:DUF6531 domain-containing protein [Stenotrophomonas indicatrix]WGV54790.1 DUF6531 domain-containing protein [Stenotrophomonas indicatrix]
MTLLKTRMSLSLALLLTPLSLFGAGAKTPPTDLERITVKPPVEDFEYPLWWSIDGGMQGGFDGGMGGGGGSFPTETAKEQPTDDKEKDCNGRKGNPVVLYSGNKVEPELDFASQGEMGLFLQRNYNHYWSATGLFGNHWLSNFDYSLAFTDANQLAWVQRPDGRRIKYLKDPASGRWYEDKAQPIAYLSANGDGTFALRNENNGTETYNAEGYITRLSNEQGVSWTFSYADRYLQKVTHSSGRSVSFGWANGQVSQVTDPAGNIYRYTYTPNVFGNGRGRLASTSLPGTPATTISYHYEDARFPGALTGKSFDGVRYSTFAYDAERRAISTEHNGGIERFRFSYAVRSTEPVLPPPAPTRPGGVRADEERGWCEQRPGGSRICYQPRSLPVGSLPMERALGMTAAAAPSLTRPVDIDVTVINPLGRSTTYTFKDGKMVSTKGDPSPNCPASYKEQSYDANGYPDLVHDFQDNLTDFDYSAQGYLLKRVEAVGSSVERTTLQEWDTTRNRLLKTTVVGDLEVAYSYDDRGNVASATERNLTARGVPSQTRVTRSTYTYHANGLKASIKVDGPLAQDDVTSVFNSQGDLISVTNALGHTISYSNYNGLGLPGRIVNANGGVRELTYDGRGRVVSDRTSSATGWATTAIGYTTAGDIASLTQPDGVTVRYGYDAGRRLTQEVRSMGDGKWAWTRHSYNNASNRTRTEVSQTDYPMDTVVSGVIDEITHDAQWNWFVRGWACSTGSAGSIQVDGYADGNVYLGSTQANLASESGVAAACQASGSAYRYQLPISLAQRQQLGGRKFSIYGQSPQGRGQDRPLANSGVFAIPTANIVGDIGGVTQDGNWNFFIEGWACSIGVDASIDVHVYAGNNAWVGGTFVAGGRANLATDGNVANACQARGNAYWFKIPLDANARSAHGGKALYVHGISPWGGDHLTINRSGAFTIPAVVRNAELVSASASPRQIFNGGSSNLTFQFRNTGNVVWNPGDTYLAFGILQLNESMGLAAPVPPGAVATFTRSVGPKNTGNGNVTFIYKAQMASGGAAWGTEGRATLSVENNKGSCGRVTCERPR